MSFPKMTRSVWFRNAFVVTVVVMGTGALAGIPVGLMGPLCTAGLMVALFWYDATHTDENGDQT